MPVNLIPPTAADVLAVPGVRWGVVEAGIRKANRKDGPADLESSVRHKKRYHPIPRMYRNAEAPREGRQQLVLR